MFSNIGLKKTNSQLYNSLFNISPVTSLLILIFIFCFIIQLSYYLFIFSRAAKKSPPLNPEKNPYPPVSVIICARNEEKNLSQHLPLVLEQEYPEFEVIVVNDCSEDDSDQLLINLQEKYKNLNVSTIQKDSKFSHGKKLALTIGIKAAKYDTLLLTDADCQPAGENWIKYIARNYQKEKKIVLGVGLYKKKKGLLNILIRFEAAFIAMQYIGFAIGNKPYMGVGRNLSYKKDLFFKNRGFASHLKLASGDDDLFINEVSSEKNVTVESHPESFTWSEPKTSFKDWKNQKKRHLTTSSHYQKSLKFWLGLEYLTRMLFIVSFILLIIRNFFPIILLGFFILYLITKGIIYYIVFKPFKEKFIFLPSLLLGELMPFLYSYLHFINLVERKDSRWQ